MMTIHKARSQGKRQAQPSAGAQTAMIPAPAEGLIETRPTGSGCLVCENMAPTERGYRVRGGKFKVADVGDPVVSLFTYSTAAVSKLYAATATDVYDITSLDPEATPSAVLTEQTAGYYVGAQLGNLSGQYLTVVNGANAAQQYDGTDWGDAEITGGVWSYIWTHKNRYWMVEAGTQSAWYLGLSAITGLAVEFPLSGVFQLGGRLLFGTTWSSDSGAGMDDRQVFVSAAGEVAIYEGSDPATAEDWALVGIYKMAAPLGPRAHVRAGGDVLIATVDGLVSLSAVVSKDPAALAPSAVSAPIANTWVQQARASSPTQRWEVAKWTEGSIVMVSLPHTGNQALVANITTGAWGGPYTGWDVQCLGTFNRGLFFGSADGCVYQAERGGSDDGEVYVARLALLPSDMGTGGSYKTANLLKATIAGSVPYNVRLSVAGDYSREFPASPSVAPTGETSDAIWDTGTFDVSRWDSVSGAYYARPIRQTGWTSQSGRGSVLSVQAQIASNSARTPDAEILSFDLLYSVGDVVT